jgi:hypothetical protein
VKSSVRTALVRASKRVGSVPVKRANHFVKSVDVETSVRQGFVVAVGCDENREGGKE